MINKVDSNQILMQLRVAAAQAKGEGVNSSSPVESNNFSTMLNESIEKVNEISQKASAITKRFEMGDPQVTLPEVMIAKAKAGFAFEGMVQVRNKVVDAYQEIMRMQV